ncbi:DUF2306 domain-containing protein [Nocardioides cavernae]|uniref:DUF2306 domain-containing protein n=1 Tax=Nocardioides cavernae TaxID=1921566 RepID=A0ABR8N531_9ACTN|nr:DUF2306 domain-containing protein [Nocardioides cavernae]MBD3923267.1 DUF2306 domain-containing protein [Nocardioides cavernae]MBM7511811.1 putative membrane protein [Nocardioides cavernae]
MSRRTGWAIPVALFALCFVPVMSGSLRLVQLAGGPEIMPADDRWAGWPVALVVHIVGAAVFALVGAFQLVAGIRRRHPRWHRRAGRVLAVAGLMVAGSALWLTLFYDPQPGTGPLLFVLRLVVASAMVGCLVVGVAAARRRDFATHRAWMIRAYALAVAAGTQVFTQGFGEAVVGDGELRGDLLKAAGWAINLAVAEWVIRRPARRRTPRAVPVEVGSR